MVGKSPAKLVEFDRYVYVWQNVSLQLLTQTKWFIYLLYSQVLQFSVVSQVSHILRPWTWNCCARSLSWLWQNVCIHSPIAEESAGETQQLKHWLLIFREKGTVYHLPISLWLNLPEKQLHVTHYSKCQWVWEWAYHFPKGLSLVMALTFLLLYMTCGWFLTRKFLKYQKFRTLQNILASIFPWLDKSQISGNAKKKPTSC